MPPNVPSRTAHRAVDDFRLCATKVIRTHMFVRASPCPVGLTHGRHRPASAGGLAVLLGCRNNCLAECAVHIQSKVFTRRSRHGGRFAASMPLPWATSLPALPGCPCWKN